MVHARDSSTDPRAITLTNAFERPRPKTPFNRNPSSGNAGMSQRCCMLIFHGAHFIHIQRVAILENGQNDGQSDGRFGRGYYHYEKGEQVAIDLLELVREGDETEIDGVQHQLDRHEDGDDAAAEEESGHTEREEDCAQD